MNRGYVKLWRKSKDSGFLGNAEAWQLLCWCLLNATHKRHKQLVGKQLVELEPGQLIFGRSSVARELHTTERKVRTCLELLKKTEFLTVRTTSKFSIITIVNWHTYQDDRPAGDQQNGQHDDHEATSKRPTNDHKQECLEQNTKEDLKTLPGDGEDADPGLDASPPLPPPVYELPLKSRAGDKPKLFPVTKALFDVWLEAYPLVDVRSELREIKAWLVSNPKKRPTSDMPRFVNAWLDRNQNAMAARQARASPSAPRRPVKSFQQQAEENVWDAVDRAVAGEKKAGEAI